LSGGCSFHFLLSKLKRCDEAQGSVWTYIVILSTPVIDNHPSFSERPQLFAVQAFFTQTCVEAFDDAILPWTTRIDVERFDLILSQPLTQGTFNELRAIVAADMLRSSVHINQGGDNLTQLWALIRRSTWMHRNSRVCSSSTLSMRSLPPPQPTRLYRERSPMSRREHDAWPSPALSIKSLA
jgi:hypothetical protein